MAIKNTVIDTTPTAIFTSGVTTASENNVVVSLYICNTSTGTVTFNLYLVPSGKIASPLGIDPVSADSNIIYYAVQVAGSDTYVIDTERLMLEQGDSIVATSTQANSLVATVSYMGI
jgi:hypothetical protein